MKINVPKNKKIIITYEQQEPTDIEIIFNNDNEGDLTFDEGCLIVYERLDQSTKTPVFVLPLNLLITIEIVNRDE